MHKVVISAELINILTIEEVLEGLVVVCAAGVPFHPGDPLGQHPAHRAHRHQDASANAVEEDEMLCELLERYFPLLPALCAISFSSHDREEI